MGFFGMIRVIVVVRPVIGAVIVLMDIATAPMAVVLAMVVVMVVAVGVAVGLAIVGVLMLMVVVMAVLVAMFVVALHGAPPLGWSCRSKKVVFIYHNDHGRAKNKRLRR